MADGSGRWVISARTQGVCSPMDIDVQSIQTVTITGDNIDIVSTYTFLGVHLDNKLEQKYR